MTLLMAGIAINLLKPWPLAVLVDSVLGSKPFPAWLPSQLRKWGQPEADHRDHRGVGSRSI